VEAERRETRGRELEDGVGGGGNARADRLERYGVGGRLRQLIIIALLLTRSLRGLTSRVDEDSEHGN
jgi:hypothetical protein